MQRKVGLLHEPSCHGHGAVQSNRIIIQFNAWSHINEHQIQFIVPSFTQLFYSWIHSCSFFKFFISDWPYRPHLRLDSFSAALFFFGASGQPTKSFIIPLFYFNLFLDISGHSINSSLGVLSCPYNSTASLLFKPVSSRHTCNLMCSPKALNFAQISFSKMK